MDTSQKTATLFGSLFSFLQALLLNINIREIALSAAVAAASSYLVSKLLAWLEKSLPSKYTFNLGNVASYWPSSVIGLLILCLELRQVLTHHLGWQDALPTMLLTIPLFLFGIDRDDDFDDRLKIQLHKAI